MENYRLSKYNFFSKRKNKVIGINLYNKHFFSIDEEKYDLLMSYKLDVDRLQKDHPLLFSTMYKLGIIENVDLDIPAILLMKNRQQVFSESHFRLFINPTLNCNFNCWYCYETHTKKRMDNETMENVIKYIENLVSKGKITTLHIDWFGGEPLLCYKTVIKPICNEIKRICSQYNVNFYMTMTTNGFLIKKEMLPFFEENNFKNFQITLDSDKENHDKTRFQRKQITGSYEKIVNNILLITKLPNAYVTLRINYTKETLFNSTNIISSFPNEVRHKLFIALAQVWQDCQTNNDSEKKDIIKIENKVRNIFISAGFMIRESKSERFLCYTCYADLYNEAVINYDGRVFKCTAINFENQKEDGVLNKNGNIIWDENYLAKRLAKAPFENSVCSKCKLLPVCFGSCSTKAFFRKDSDNKCFAKDKIKNVIYRKMDKFSKANYKIADINQI